MQLAKKVKFTYQDYLLLSEYPRYELIEGDLSMTPSPNWDHQGIASRLFFKLQQFVSKKKLGEIRFAPLDVVLSEEDVVQPDLVFISKNRLSEIVKTSIMGAPDLVIEILSPGTEKRDRIIKRKLYEQYGIKEFWIVDPQNKSIEVVGWKKSDFVTFKTYPETASLKSPLLKGFNLKVRQMFEGIR